MKITIFSEELRKCLSAAGLSDCGENDTGNYWYQRLMNAYNESVERQIMTEQAENAKLRELVRDMWGNGHPDKSCGDCEIMDECHAEIEEERKKGNGRWNTRCLFELRIEQRMHELGVDA